MTDRHDGVVGAARRTVDALLLAVEKGNLATIPHEADVLRRELAALDSPLPSDADWAFIAPGEHHESIFPAYRAVCTWTLRMAANLHYGSEDPNERRDTLRALANEMEARK